MADKWFYAQNKKLQLMPVDGQELQWLIRRGSFRGILGNHLFYADVGKKHLESGGGPERDTKRRKDIASVQQGYCKSFFRKHPSGKKDI